MRGGAAAWPIPAGALLAAFAFAPTWPSCQRLRQPLQLSVLRLGENASDAVPSTVPSSFLPWSLSRLLGQPDAEMYAADGRRVHCAADVTAGATVFVANASRPWQWVKGCEIEPPTRPSLNF